MHKCKGCTERHPGCHGECKAYLRTKHVQELKSAYIRKQKENEQLIRYGRKVILYG